MISCCLPNTRAVILNILFALSALGQGAKGDYSVSGTVRNTLTGEPVRNALVVLQLRPDLPGEPQTKAILSGPGGEFTLTALPMGHYNCSVQKEGFAQDPIPNDYESVVIPRGAAIQLKLTPLGAIEGRVINQYDEPLESILLAVYSVEIRHGEKSARNVGTVWTDDRGLFHLAYLDAGTYCVKAVGRNGGTETHVGPEPMRYAPWESFSPVYFGGASDIGSAALIPVGAGTHVRTDFQLAVQRAFKIRGKIEGYTAREPVSFELLRGDDPAVPSRAILDGSTGQFEILDVIPGAYRLRATQADTRGEAMVNVSGQDLSGLSIVLSPPVTVSGFMRSLGVPADPHAPSSCQVSLHQRWQPDSRYMSKPQESGQFIIEGLFPGEYRVTLQCYGGYPRSASFGSADLLADPAITISSNAPPPPIEVEYKPGGGSLRVKFAGEIPPQGAVLVAPVFSASAGPVLQAATGTVVFTNLAPGDYSVFALSQLADAEYRSPAFLQSLSGGASVHLEDGTTVEIAITRFSK